MWNCFLRGESIAMVGLCVLCVILAIVGLAEAKTVGDYYRGSVSASVGHFYGQ